MVFNLALCLLFIQMTSVRAETVTCAVCPAEKICPTAPSCPGCLTQAPQSCPVCPTFPPSQPKTCPACPTVPSCPASPTCPPTAACSTCPPEKACPTAPSCPILATEKPKTTCDAGWKYWNTTNSCYFVGKQAVNGTEAQKLCRSQGGDLVSIHSNEEAVFVADYGNSTQSPGNAAWIGQYRTGPSVTNWENHDGTPMDFINWRPSQPDNYQNSQFCNAIVLNSVNYAKWDDSNCPTLFFYICKKPAN